MNLADMRQTIIVIVDEGSARRVMDLLEQNMIILLFSRETYIPITFITTAVTGVLGVVLPPLTR